MRTSKTKHAPQRPNTKSSTFKEADTLHRNGEYLQAQALYLQMLEREPENAELLQRLGLVQMELDNLTEAMNLIEKSIAINGKVASYFSNYAVVLHKMKHYEAALLCCDSAIALKPRSAAAHSNRGNALRMLGQKDEAIACYQKALSLDPQHYQTVMNLGLAYKDLGDVRKGLIYLQRTVALNPHFGEAHWNLAVTCLVLGEFEEGWKEYEWRFKEKSLKIHRSKYSTPNWLGNEPLQGRTIFIYHEQGYGDAIQFCRYALELANLGATVLLEVHAPLRGLFAPFHPHVRIVELNQVLPPLDFQCPLMSLPLALKTRLHTIPAPFSASTQNYVQTHAANSFPRLPRYLETPPERLAQWQARLGPKSHAGALRIGLTWSGNPGHVNDNNRSIALQTVLENLPRLEQLPPGSQYFSLQRDARESDFPAIEAHEYLIGFGKELRDFSDTAALCDLMDVVISVDTSVAHLSAALARPTWILIPFDPEWRWLLERSDSPWYPSVRLYRQTTSNDWAEVLARVAADLCAGRIEGLARP